MLRFLFSTHKKYGRVLLQHLDERGTRAVVVLPDRKQSWFSPLSQRHCPVWMTFGAGRNFTLFVLEESENGMAIYETDGSGRSRIGRIRHG